MSAPWDISTEDALLKRLVAAGATSASAATSMCRGNKTVLRRARELGLKWRSNGRAQHFARLGAIHAAGAFPNAGGKPQAWTNAEDIQLTDLVDEGASLRRIRSVMKKGAESVTRRLGVLGLRLHEKPPSERKSEATRQYKPVGASPYCSDAEVAAAREQRDRERAYIAQVNAERIRIFSQPYCVAP